MIIIIIIILSIMRDSFVFIFLHQGRQSIEEIPNNCTYETLYESGAN